MSASTAAAATAAAAVPPAHHNHNHTQHQSHHYSGMQQSQQPHSVSWADHYPPSTMTAPSSFDFSSPSMKMDFRPPGSEWATNVRPQSLAYPAYSPHPQAQHQDQQHNGDGGHSFFQQQSASSRPDISNGAPFWTSFSTAHATHQPQQPHMPSPPPSDGSPRSEWANAHHHRAAAAAAAAAANNPNDAQDGRVPHAGLQFNRNSPVLRSDGVRKKNAKFEIPEERNLETLDSLIRNAKDDGERREFKMQKRLLRNREAALHSRQKKKNHTETLERENKNLYSKITEFQHQITSLKIQVDDFQKERGEARATADERVRAMRLERDVQAKENMRLSAEIHELRAQLRNPGRSSSAGSRTTASTAQTAGGSAAGRGDVPFAAGDWHEPGYDFLADMCLDTGAASKMHGRPDDVRADVVVR